MSKFCWYTTTPHLQRLDQVMRTQMLLFAWELGPDMKIAEGNWKTKRRKKKKIIFSLKTIFLRQLHSTAWLSVQELGQAQGRLRAEAGALCCRLDVIEGAAQPKERELKCVIG